MIVNKRITLPKDFSTVAVFDIIAKLLAAVTSVLLIRVLATSVYANYVKFNAISSLIFGVIGTSMSVAYARGGTEYTSRGFRCLKTIYTICFSLLLIVTIIMTLFLPVFSKVYSVSIVTALFALIYGFVQSVNRVNESYFQVKGDFKVAGLLDNTKHICLIALLLGSIAISINYDSIIVFVLFIISAMIPVIIGNVLIGKSEKYIVDDKLDKETTRLIFSEASTLIIYWLLLNLIDQTDIILVTRMLNETALSNYGVALKYYQLLLTFQASLGTVLRIRTSKKEVVDSKEQQRAYSINWIKKTWLLILTIVILANVFAAPVMNWLNGDRYVSAVPAFRVFVFGAAISYLFAPNTAVMMSAKKHKLLCVYTAIGFVINALIDLLLIPYIGIIAAAMATVSGNAFLNIASFLTIVKRRMLSDETKVEIE